MRVALALIVALLALAPPLAAAQTGPTAEMVMLRSHALGEDRAINIYVPPGYAQGNARYPVLYVLDGGLREAFAPMTVLVEAGIARGELRELIVVGVAQRNRDAELLPSNARSARFRRFIADEVKPWVEANYRTNGEDAISGGSYAGLFVVYTLLYEPALFDDYIAMSPSLGWDRGALVRRSADLLVQASPAPHRLWLSVANEGPLMQVDSFAQVLKERAPAWLSWSFTPFPRETHSSTYVPATRKWLPELFPAAR